MTISSEIPLQAQLDGFVQRLDVRPGPERQRFDGAFLMGATAAVNRVATLIMQYGVLNASKALEQVLDESDALADRFEFTYAAGDSPLKAAEVLQRVSRD